MKLTRKVTRKLFYFEVYTKNVHVFKFLIAFFIIIYIKIL